MTTPSVPAFNAVERGINLEALVVFSEQDLERIGVVCPHCGTESIFNLTKDQAANTDRSCPGCGNADYLARFVMEAKQEYNWITYYKRVRDLAKNVQIRFYFKRT
jgi:transcription elongation factor Elf1